MKLKLCPFGHSVSFGFYELHASGIKQQLKLDLQSIFEFKTVFNVNVVRM
jgi:hypothetical protein